MMTRILCLFLLLATLSPTGRAEAQTQGDVHFDPVVDLSLTIPAAVFLLGSQLVIGSGELGVTTPGPADRLLAIDRATALRTEESFGGSVLSNVGLLTLGAVAVLSPLALTSRSWNERGERVLLHLEALTLTLALTNLAKIAFRRPRPLTYGADPASLETDDSLSFFSGHTASAAALSAVATYLSFADHGSAHPRPWLTLAGTLLGTILVGLWRMDARKHFPTDVLVGGVIGAGLGVLLAHAHTRSSSARPSVTAGSTLGLSGTF